METLADAYHVEVVHRDTFGKSSTGYKPQTSNVKLNKYGSTKQYVSPTFAPNGQVLFGPMPWLADHPSGDHVAMSHFLRPNFAFFARCDMIHCWMAQPMSPTRTRVNGWICMPKEFANDPDFQQKVQLIADYNAKVNQEDRDLIHALQKATTSRYYPSGPVHELERLAYHRNKGYLAAMAGNGDAR
jgi:phenylpropionate dioxygenase-like ring-hydroxylating dioxygenase large terminal subunit